MVPETEHVTRQYGESSTYVAIIRLMGTHNSENRSESHHCSQSHSSDSQCFKDSQNADFYAVKTAKTVIMTNAGLDPAQISGTGTIIIVVPSQIVRDRVNGVIYVRTAITDQRLIYAKKGCPFYAVAQTQGSSCPV